MSIVGVDTGAQPLVNDEGTVSLAVNGEIYNHVELREGHLRDPRTDSDSEAALSAVIAEDSAR